ncbi:conserved hypothetical protein [Methanosalsum zhilinae DSM 4017]|uniref:DUF2124 domain-containing protein n=1 Tax=Methanosalsum zhilinae (strain DSM 4017 / NBRC 107636 / OCM 62 / WeN5) TaxID=679901 RepID=F7XL23_METZD|nr:DUF2124 domain-containing protein [Methanosalsum zhilinae]AEH60731.1 conserved hypothetical protein [Methanosalsum zhilinae DSM 4017]
MELLLTSKGIGGQLKSFKDLVKDSEEITFVGTPGFCTPFAELLSFTLRDSEKRLVFVPNMDKDSAKILAFTDDGMQLRDTADPLADTVVLLGGLAIPKNQIDPQNMNRFVQMISKGRNSKIIGVCFQSIFQEQKWTDHIKFDYIIDADLSVEVIKM